MSFFSNNLSLCTNIGTLQDTMYFKSHMSAALCLATGWEVAQAYKLKFEDDEKKKIKIKN